MTNEGRPKQHSLSSNGISSQKSFAITIQQKDLAKWHMVRDYYPKDPHTMKSRRSYNRLIPKYKTKKEMQQKHHSQIVVKKALRKPYTIKDIKVGTMAFVEVWYFDRVFNELLFKEYIEIEVMWPDKFQQYLDRTDW